MAYGLRVRRWLRLPPGACLIEWIEGTCVGCGLKFANRLAAWSVHRGAWALSVWPTRPHVAGRGNWDRVGVKYGARPLSQRKEK